MLQFPRPLFMSKLIKAQKQVGTYMCQAQQKLQSNFLGSYGPEVLQQWWTTHFKDIRYHNKDWNNKIA